MSRARVTSFLDISSALTCSHFNDSIQLSLAQFEILPLLACWTPRGTDLTILVTSYFDDDEEEEEDDDNDDEKEENEDDNDDE